MLDGGIDTQMKTLNHHQRYLLEEFAEDYLDHRMARRELLRRSLLATGSIALTATTLFALGCSNSDDEGEEPAASSPAGTNTLPTPAGGSGAAPQAPQTGGGPVVAEDDPSVRAQDVTFPGPGSQILGYLASPAEEGMFPAVLIIHENRGLLPHFEDVARRYAKEGFVGLAMDMASRLGGTATAGEQVTQIDPTDLVADMEAALDYLQSLEFVEDTALGVTGFCFGGGFVFDLAAASPDIQAAVPYYGTARRALEEGLGETQAAILVMYGANDTRITSEQPDVEAALQASGSPYEIMVHEGAGHAFFNNTGGSYNEAAATAAWSATIEWFREYLAT
jgi:carboxymethylenebutenolidase